MYHKNVIGFPPAPAQPILFGILDIDTQSALMDRGYVFLHIGVSQPIEEVLRSCSFNNTRRGIEEWLNEVPERKHIVEDRTVTK